MRQEGRSLTTCIGRQGCTGESLRRSRSGCWRSRRQQHKQTLRPIPAWSVPGSGADSDLLRQSGTRRILYRQRCRRMVPLTARTELRHLGSRKLWMHRRHSWCSSGNQPHRLGQREHRDPSRLVRPASALPVSLRTGGTQPSTAQLRELQRNDLRDDGGHQHLLRAWPVQVFITPTRTWLSPRDRHPHQKYWFDAEPISRRGRPCVESAGP